METQPETKTKTFNFTPKTNPHQILTILQALKQASRALQKNPNSITSSPSIKALLELDISILSNDPQLATLSTHLTSLKTLVHSSCISDHPHHALKSFIINRVNSHEISRLAGLIESEIQAWINREFIETLTQSLRKACEIKDEYLIDLIEQFEERIAKGFDHELQDLILRSKVFAELETILNECQVLMGNIVRAIINLSSVRAILVLTKLINSIKSPIIDEIVSNGEITKIVSFLSSEDLLVRVQAFDCLLEIGYYGRKEAIEAMLEEDLVKKLVELQKCKIGEKQQQAFAGCVARFAVQLEVGEGLRQREKRALKQQVLKKVREACVCDPEVATIISEVLWGASP
ncbi:uncharacterized protein [Rutidosis leptorrhynchoides]|uniref:uncharacterized protein n=1 Tax=Rutidosis leptorrhynchoides TaxID=125765 RepID=UPI003A9A6189